jgi:hypothetical protein
MKLSKIAQLVKELEESGLENEATELADAIIEETDPNQILSRPDINNSIDSIVGGVLYHLNLDNNISFQGDRVSDQTLIDITNSLAQIVKSS